jgi:hypothetical protein
MQQRRTTKVFRHLLVVSFGVLLVIEFMRLNFGEAEAIYWHLRHGSSERCCGAEVRVPLMYFGVEGDKESIFLISAPGYFRSRLFHSPSAMLGISQNSTALDEEHLQQSSERLINAWGKRGYQLLGTRTIQIAGSSLKCWEFHLEHLDAFGPNDQVFCMGHDKFAHFSGSPVLRDEFYSIVRTARTVSR